MATRHQPACDTLRLIVVWQNGQLGQITKLLTGNDRGWRGGVDLTANMHGTPESLVIESQARFKAFGATTFSITVPYVSLRTAPAAITQ